MSHSLLQPQHRCPKCNRTLERIWLTKGVNRKVLKALEEHVSGSAYLMALGGITGLYAAEHTGGIKVYMCPRVHYFHVGPL